MATVPPAYDSLCTAARKISLLNGASSVLGWDQETYMPSKGIEHRSRILAHLSGLAHEQFTNGAFEKLLEAAEAEAQRCEPVLEVRANLERWRHQLNRAVKLPQTLVEQHSAAVSLGQAAWSKAKQNSAFNEFAPHLERLVGFAQQQASCWGWQNEAYDALLDGYEPGAQTHEIQSLFQALRPEVSKIARDAVAFSQSYAPADSSFYGYCPIDRQKTLNREIAEAIGFDFEAGRIYETSHPFCSGFGPGDTRLTTRYDERDFTSSLFGIMHEAGHGLYDQGLNSAAWGLPSGEAVSLGIHESQSRLWENHVGRSRSFWQKWFPVAQNLFTHLNHLTLDEFMLGINRAAFSFVRVEADESTYDLHIMLRFAIERELLNGSLKVSEVPAYWNDEFKKSFGVTPPNDRLGCLQDIHWSMGGFGYFPTYTLGNLNAAQLFKQALQVSQIQTDVQNAEYATLLEWLRQNVHQWGSQLSPQDLMQRATGRTTQSADYLTHLSTRFCSLQQSSYT